MTAELDQGYVPGRGRRAEARRRRQRRQRRLLALGLVLALLATAGIAYLAVRSSPEPESEVEPPGRTQRTLLFQLRGRAGAAASALLAHDPEASRSDDPDQPEPPRGAVVLVPPQVIVDVPGAGSVPFGQALTTGDPNGSRNALSDLLGVLVDASWVVDQPAFEALVQAVGGLEVEAAVPVVRDNAVLVPQGRQRVDGPRAVAYMTYLAPGEPEQVRLDRLNDVLQALLAALPAEATALTDVLAPLGPGSQTSLPPAELAAFLSGLAADLDDVQPDVLPVIPIDPGGGVTSFRIDAEAARALVDRLLAQSVPPGARQTGNRVLVENGVGTPGLGEAVRSKLVAADFVFVGSRNAERFGYARTQVFVPEATPEGQALGRRVAEALGVDAEIRQGTIGNVADVVVRVGSDFRP